MWFFRFCWIQGVQQRVAGTVSRRRGTCRLLAAEVFRLAAERALINTAVVKTGERQAHMFQLKNRFRAGLTHIFDGVLVANIVRPFYGVVHSHSQLSSWELPSATVMPPCADTVWERVGNTLESSAQVCPLWESLQRRAHTCAAGTDNNSIKLSDWQFHYTPHTTTNP